MEKVETFLALYNKLDEYLRRNAGQGRRDLSLGQRLDALVEKHPTFRRSAAKLKDYGDLRNSIIHHRDPNGGVIAVPTDEALREFDQLVQAILSPLKLLPRFQNVHIRAFHPREPLVAALQHMREYDYSQVVVQEESKISLLTVEGIARWLEEQAQEEMIIMQEATIADALKYEPAESVVIMRRDQTVYEAMEIFQRAIEQRKPRIYALLITEHGKATEHPLGIITPWDLLPDPNSQV